MPFNDNFDTTDPIPTDLANKIDSYIRAGTKAALAERYLLEHYALQIELGPEPHANSAEQSDPNAQGRHIAGKVGCLGYGTLAERALLFLPGVGALWEATDEDLSGPYPAGTIYRFTGSGWIPAQLLVGTIYATAEEALAGEVTDKAISPATMADVEYIPLTAYSGIAAELIKEGEGDWTYDINLFEGVGLVTDEIRVIHIQSHLVARDGWSNQYVGMPDGTEVEIATSSGNDDANGQKVIVAIPITKGQTQLNFRAVRNGGQYESTLTFVGVTQRTI